MDNTAFRGKREIAVICARLRRVDYRLYRWSCQVFNLQLNNKRKTFDKAFTNKISQMQLISGRQVSDCNRLLRISRPLKNMSVIKQECNTFVFKDEWNAFECWVQYVYEYQGGSHLRNTQRNLLKKSIKGSAHRLITYTHCCHWPKMCFSPSGVDFKQVFDYFCTLFNDFSNEINKFKRLWMGKRIFRQNSHLTYKLFLKNLMT